MIKGSIHCLGQSFLCYLFVLLGMFAVKRMQNGWTFGRSLLILGFLWKWIASSKNIFCSCDIVAYLSISEEKSFYFS